MSFFDLDNLAQLTQGSWKRAPTTPSTATGLSIDTRTMTAGQIYCAIRGEQFDGHDFAAAAADAGASLLLVDREGIAGRTAHCPVLHVADTIEALGTLGRAYRRTLTATVIGITGSAGKTTTKQLIESVLKQKISGSASPRSFNNAIGVPLTLLAASIDDQFVLCEIGTNAPGEIRSLGRIAEPDIAVITTVGAAHLEGLGSVAAVLDEKASLLECRRDGGLAVVHADVAGLAERAGSNVVTFGTSESASLRLTHFEPTDQGCRFTVNGTDSYRLMLRGAHNASNALAAIAVGQHLGLDTQTIAAGLASAPAPNMRLAFESLGSAGSITLINDAYNANPLSVRASLSVLVQTPGNSRRVAILGDMGELGAETERHHRESGRAAAEFGVELLIYIGPLGRHAADAALEHGGPEVHWFENWDEQVGPVVAKLCTAHDTILLKASRAAALERVIPYLVQRADALESSS